VRAPFSGVVGQRMVSLGDYVNTSSELLTLQTVSPQRAVFTVPERYASVLKRGQQVTFQVAAITGRTFDATVDFVDPIVALPGRTITVKALAPNPGGVLQAGMFIEARLATAVRTGATVIPEEAVSPTASGAFVWVVQGDKATRREVELGVRTPGFVEVRKGVEPGDRVVVGGLERLSEGASVRATEVERRPQGAREG
jgi:RND family efflux transporter MFP subunit